MNGVIKKWKKGVIRQNIVGTHVETQLVKIEKGGKKIMKKDEEIMEDRMKKYGPPRLFFQTYGQMCQLLDIFAEASGQESINEGHLAALKQVLLKVLRSTWDPNHLDNYCDARNYISISEKCIIENQGKGDLNAKAKE